MEFSVRSTKGVIFSFYCLLLIISLSAYGQDQEITDILDENQVLKSELDNTDLNRITLQQMGEQNRATVMQLTGNDNPNLVKVYQEGYRNNSTLIQSGQHNATDIYQEGVGNSYLGIHIGEDIINSVIQDGNENVIRQFLIGNDMDFQIVQEGTGHEVNQIQTGNGKGYKVTQTGRDMNITIIQEHVLRR